MELEGRQLPNRLRKQRLMHGYTQLQVAKMLGMKSTNQISLWEKGISTPSLRYLLHLCIIYNTLIEEFYFEYLLELRKEHVNHAKKIDESQDGTRE